MRRIRLSADHPPHKSGDVILATVPEAHALVTGGQAVEIEREPLRTTEAGPTEHRDPEAAAPEAAPQPNRRNGKRRR